MGDQGLTLLSEGQIWGNDSEPQLEVIKKYGVRAAVTDLCILTGCFLFENTETGRTGLFWTKSDAGDSDVYSVVENGYKSIICSFARRGAVRPILRSSEISSQITQNRVRGYNGTEEVEYGEYPQNAADSRMQNILELEYNRGMYKTGRSYTFNSMKYDDYSTGFKPVTYEEYEYQGKKYIRIKANFQTPEKYKLSNGIEYEIDDYVWVEVSPVKWLIDEDTGILVSKKGLLSGIRFDGTNYKGDFDRTEMKKYLDNYMLRDLSQIITYASVQDMAPEEKAQFEKKQKEAERRSNPYGFKFEQVSEEEIIRGAIESGVAVFLHGPSSEGKSARVKQIDPTCEIIYLRNATPDSLNGKSVYNASTGEMIDVKPSWLKKLEAKCEQEPERLHVLFLDEITNALPSIQGMAFNIVLNGEVNGIWKLPENARIVAAGNDMKESLAANQLAEPLFNRFAHVYIKTTTESWLKWASENNIHPAIYSYIAYKNGKTLRSKYDGEYPNADPRKWEMASKMLYKTGSPEMLRALVGEDITREFVKFCNQKVITLDDVINGNYNDKDIQELNTAERYATIMGLSCASEENLEVVRNFANILGKEFKTIFDSLWTHDDEKRLERLAEAKLAEMQKGVSRKL